MPIYEYGCQGCGREFETLVQGSRKPECPGCGGKKLSKKLSVFAVSTGSEGGRGADLPEACRGCGHPDGPGSCGMNRPG